jgi:glycosyltransferase involved in cell wall biosynthesis
MPPSALVAVCPNFPTPGSASDGQAIYLHHATRALHEATGMPVVVAALRIGSQTSHEEHGWCEIWRAEPPEPLRSVFDAYEPGRFPQVLEPLAGLAVRRAAELRAQGRRPVGWCHGYETAGAAAALRSTGAPTVAVVHYSIAQESLYDLGLADDPVRRRAVGGLLPAMLSTAIRPSLRPHFVRASSLGARAGGALPLPRVLKLQLDKLAMERRLLADADRVVAVGESFAGALGALYPSCRSKISWCYAGAPEPRDRAPRAGADRLRLLMVGRPSLQKGWDYAAEALLLLERHSPGLADRLELTAVGGLGNWDGPPSVYADNVLARFGELRRVRLENAGHLAAADLGARYAAADVLLHPSVFEPFGLVIVEAMRQGCLVLASDTDGPRDLLRPPFGWLVPFREPRRRAPLLAEALARVAALSAGEIERGRAAARQACSGLSWARCAEGHLGAIKEACGAPCADARRRGAA